MIRILVAALFGLVLAYASWARTGDTPIGTHPFEPVTVWVESNGFHTDIVVPRQALLRHGGALATTLQELADGEAVRIGWGDARFFVDQRPIHHRLPDGARALFMPGNASVVMLSTQVHLPLGPDTERRVRLVLPVGQFAALVRRIEQSLDLTSGTPRRSAAIAGGTLFLASTQTFWAGRTCNHWTADVLNAGGVTIHPGRAFLAGAVIGDARRSAALDTAARAD